MKLTRTTITRYSLYIIAVLLLVNAGRVQLPKVGATATLVPYTVVLQERVFSKDSSEGRVASTQTWAVRSDGARVIKMGNEGRGSRLIELPSGIHILTNDVTRAKSTTRHPPRPQTFAIDANCQPAGNPAFIGFDHIAGIRTAKYRRSADDRSDTAQYAIDYGCQKVGSVLEFNTGERSETVLLSFTPGPPRADLFSVPEDYREGPPSNLRTQEEKAAPCSPACRNNWLARDAEYEKSRIQH